MKNKNDECPIRLIPNPGTACATTSAAASEDAPVKTIRSVLDEQLSNLYCRSVEALRYAVRIKRSLFPDDEDGGEPERDKETDKYRLIFPYLMHENNKIYGLIEQTSRVLGEILSEIGEEK